MGAGDFVVAAHRAFYFLPLYEPLEHHAGIVLQGEVHGRLQLRHVPRLGDAHAGARVGGLDENGPAQFFRRAPGNDRQLWPLPALHAVPFTAGNARCIHHTVGNDLIHAHRAAQHAAAHIGQAGQLQQALYRAVLAVFAVQHGKHHVHGQAAADAVFKRHKPRQPAARADGCGHIAGVALPGAAAKAFHRAGVQIPAPVFRDAHGQHVVFFRVQIVQHAGRAHARHLVLAGRAAEQYGDFQFLQNTPHLSSGRRGIKPWGRRPENPRAQNALLSGRPEKGFRDGPLRGSTAVLPCCPHGITCMLQS